MLKKLALSVVLGSMLVFGGINPASADPLNDEVRESFVEATADEDVSVNRFERGHYRSHHGFNHFGRGEFCANGRFDRYNNREYRANDRYDRYERDNRPHHRRHYNRHNYRGGCGCDDYCR